MPLRSRLVSLWRNVMHRDRVERELDDELRSVFQLLVREKLEAGLTAEDARRAVFAELGGLNSVRDEVQAARSGVFAAGIVREGRWAVRTLVRGGSFSVVAVLTLALGIGANGAIFSLVNELMLRPLPYPESDRLVEVVSPLITADNLGEWRGGLRSFERVGAYGLRGPVLTGNGAAERLAGMVVTEEFLPLLGGIPVLGRLWTTEEHGGRGAQAVVVSERLWNRLRDRDRGVGNAVIMLDGEGYTVIGVLPSSFESLHYDSEIWFPGGRTGTIVGLLRPGATLPAVRSEAESLAERITVEGLPERMQFARVFTLAEFYSSEVRGPLGILFAAAGVVLLIACANVANLLLTRATGRAQEMAVRTALGAGRATILRQLLVESAVLAGAGAIVGWFLATAGLHAILALVPETYAFGRITDVRMDRVVLGFTFVVACITTMLAGLAPALHGSKQVSRAAAGFGRSSATQRTQRMREALVVVEIGLALVLLIGALLLIRTFLVLRPTSPGFAVDDRMAVSIRLPAAPERSDAAKVAFVRRLLDDVRTAAPTASAAVATDVPLSGLTMRFAVAEVDGRAAGPLSLSRDQLDLVAATPDYFEVIGMRLVRGRGLRPVDLAGAEPVMVINESAAATFWPGVEPIGRRIALEVGNGGRVEFSVIGVVADARSTGNHTHAWASGFVSFWQLPWDGFELVVHQPREAALTGDDMRSIVASIDASVPVGTIRMMRQMADRAVAVPRYQTIVMIAFGGLALVLAVIGCYGVLSYSVAQRTGEIGVRAALGASGGDIVRAIVARAALLVAAGLALGLGAAVILTRILESSLYGVTPTDPATFAAAAAALALVSITASYLPARRAARVEPVTALRSM